MTVKAPYFPHERLVAIAREFLEEHHSSGEMPVPIEQIIDVSFGIDIVPVPGLRDSFEIDGAITADLGTIYVDESIYKRYPARYRFSLAHELAHRIIHVDVFQQLHYSTISQWKAAVASIPPDEYGWIEFQAYCLAGLLLVPPPRLAESFGRMEERARGAGVNLRELDDASRQTVAAIIAKEFAVSAQVITRRMKKDGLWK